MSGRKPRWPQVMPNDLHREVVRDMRDFLKYAEELRTRRLEQMTRHGDGEPRGLRRVT